MLAVFLAFLGGLFIVTSKFINNAASEKLGLLPGSVINYIVGTLAAGGLALVLTQDLSIHTTALVIPWYYYLAGVFGLMAMVLSNMTLHRLPVLHSTTLIVTFQMITALSIDYFLFGQFSYVKSLGAGVVVIALIWDQHVIKKSHKTHA